MLREQRGCAARCLLCIEHLQESVRHKRYILSWVAGVAVAMNAAAAPGYLPVVGPSPLRFEVPKSPPKTNTVLPPLPTVEVLTGTNLPPENGAALTPFPDPPASVSSNASALSLVIVIQTNAPALPAPELLPLAPQMFMPYFTRNVGTNGGAVAVPLTFLPPAPLGPPPSSTASYEVTPANPTTPPAAAPKVTPHSAPGTKP